MKRLFAAARISPTETFIRSTERMKNAFFADKITWVEYSKLHLTLKFFGETPEAKIPAITEALKMAAAMPPFPVFIKGIGIFGSSYDPRVIWYGIEEQGRLSALVENVNRCLAGAGFETDRQNYVPHLTVGRIKFIRDKEFFQKWMDNYRSIELQPAQIAEFYLFESVNGPEGPEYTVLETFPLVLE